MPTSWYTNLINLRWNSIKAKRHCGNLHGLAKAGVQFLGTAETDEFDLQKLGDAALGLTTAFHYSAAHASPANKQFIEALKQRDPIETPAT